MNKLATLGRVDEPQFDTFGDIITYFFDSISHMYISLEEKRVHFQEFKSRVVTHMHFKRSMGKYSEDEMLKILYWTYRYLYNKNYHSLPQVIPKTLDDAWTLIGIQIEQFGYVGQQMKSPNHMNRADTLPQKSVKDTVYNILDGILRIVSRSSDLVYRKKGEEN